MIIGGCCCCCFFSPTLFAIWKYSEAFHQQQRFFEDLVISTRGNLLFYWFKRIHDKLDIYARLKLLKTIFLIIFQKLILAQIRSFHFSGMTQDSEKSFILSGAYRNVVTANMDF